MFFIMFPHVPVRLRVESLMRILLIARCPPYPLHLGDRLIIYHLVRHLRQRGHTVDLLAFANRAADWHEQHHYAADYGHVELIAEPTRAPVSYLLRQLVPARRFPRRAAESWSPPMWRAIRQRLEAQRYDAIHLFGGVQVYEYAHALGGQPAVITPYESYSLYLRRKLDLQKRGTAQSRPKNSPFNGPVSEIAAGFQPVATAIQHNLARAFETWMFTPYPRVVVVSPPDRDELRRLNPSLPVDVIPNGIDLDDFAPTDTERAPAALLFVGNYDYEPNRDAALHLARAIFPAVQARVPGAKLWLVGNNPPPDLRDLASDAIDVTGRVPDVRPYLARATIFVSPLRLGAGIKNKVLEALAMGLPVVATPLSVDGIDVRDGETALIADSAMVGAIVRLLNDRDLQTRLSQNGRRLIETRYSWAQVAARYEQVYETLSR